MAFAGNEYLNFGIISITKNFHIATLYLIWKYRISTPIICVWINFELQTGQRRECLVYSAVPTSDMAFSEFNLMSRRITTSGKDEVAFKPQELSVLRPSNRPPTVQIPGSLPYELYLKNSKLPWPYQSTTDCKKLAADVEPRCWPEALHFFFFLYFRTPGPTSFTYYEHLWQCLASFYCSLLFRISHFTVDPYDQISETWSVVTIFTKPPHGTALRNAISLVRRS